MLFIIIFSVCLIVAIVLTVLKGYFRFHDSDGLSLGIVAAWACTIATAVLTIVILPTVFYKDKEKVSIFKKQKYYLEQVVPTLPQTENYAITQAKIEQNEILYELKWDYENLSFVFFLPSEIKDLEPIK